MALLFIATPSPPYPLPSPPLIPPTFSPNPNPKDCIYFVFIRENSRKLALENEALQIQVEQTEKDTVEVVGFLKHQDEDKEKQVSNLLAKSWYHVLDILLINICIIIVFLFSP